MPFTILLSDANRAKRRSHKKQNNICLGGTNLQIGISFTSRKLKCPIYGTIFQREDVNLKGNYYDMINENLYKPVREKIILSPKICFVCHTVKWVTKLQSSAVKFPVKFRDQSREILCGLWSVCARSFWSPFNNSPKKHRTTLHVKTFIVLSTAVIRFVIFCF